MAKEFSKPFYNSKAWNTTRVAYAKSKAWLCEDCLKRGITTPGQEVHHVIELTPLNITNPEIALSWDNLCLLCHDCHMARHEAERVDHGREYRRNKRSHRYTVDPNTGTVTVKG